MRPSERRAKLNLPRILVALAVLGILVGLGLGAPALYGRRMDAESKAFVDRTLPDVLDGWHTSALIGLAAPELLATASSDKLEAVFGTLRRQFGQLTHYGGADGQALIFFHFFPFVTEVRGEYTAEGAFQRGLGRVSVRVIRRSGEWRYLMVNMSPVPGGPAA